MLIQILFAVIRYVSWFLSRSCVCYPCYFWDLLCYFLL